MPLHAEILDNDLTIALVGARIGLEHGWSHIYSLDLQRQAFAQLRPHQPFHSGSVFLYPPPYAWLVVPLTAIGPAAATYAALAVLGAALVTAWWIAAPGAGAARWLWLLGALAWYPVLYSLSLVQPDLLLLLLVAAAWRLAASGRHYAAGGVLGLAVIKPQLVVVLPLILLAAGRWRIVASCAAVAGMLALLSLLAIGQTGLDEFRSVLASAQNVPNNRYFTLAYVLGPGWPAYTAAAGVVAVASAAAYANRRAGEARIFALGVVATALSATYWHLQDFTILVLAAWLFWREGAPAWQGAVLLAVAIAAELAWPLTPLPLLVAIAAWLACLSWPQPTRPAEREPATA